MFIDRMFKFLFPKPHQYGIAHYFSAFLVFACVIPFLVFSGILFYSFDKLLDRQEMQQLRTNRLLIQSRIETMEEQLLLTLVDPPFGPSFKTQPNRSTIDLELKNNNNLSFLLLTNPSSHLVKALPYPLTSSVYSELLKNVHQQIHLQQPFSGIEKLKLPESQESKLYLVAGRPIPYGHTPDGRSSLVYLIVGKDFSRAFEATNHLLKNSNNHFQLLKVEQGHRILLLDNMPKQRLLSSRGINIPIKNPRGEVIAEVHLLKQHRLFSLLQKEAIFLLLYLVIIGVIITLAVLWFYRSVINPLNELAHMATRVSTNELSALVPESGAIGEVRQTIDKFNRMVKQLALNENMRNTFIASLTHDLRTPLLSEKRVLELFQEYNDELPDQFVKLSRNLQDSNLYLIDMVNTILEIYKYEAGKIPMNYQSVDLDKLIDDIFSQLTPLALKKNIALHYFPDTQGLTLYADPQQLKRVLINLIGNAMENIPRDCWVQVYTHPLANGIRIQVRDNGPGIPPEMLKGLFERYTSGSYKAKKIGSGLGLYICRCIIDAHHGTLTVESHEGEGACLTITLPKQPETSHT